MRKLRTALVGAGKVAHIHAHALQRLDFSELRAVYNHRIGRAREFSDQYDISPYADIDEMVRKEKIDMVTVCTPHPAHRPGVTAALEAGAHVIVEKPLAVSLTDCDAMIKLAEKKGLKLGMISQRRLYQPVLRVREAIDRNRIGRPVIGTVTMYGWRGQDYYESDPWRGTWEKEGGGVLVNQAPHQLDLLQWFMGDIEEVYGYWANFNHPYIDVEDTALAMIRFKSGAMGNILVSNAQDPAIYGKVHVFGSSGAAVGVQTDGGAMFIAGMSGITEPPYNDLWTIPGEEEKKEIWRKDDAEFFNKIEPTEYFHEWQLRDFLESILEDRDPMVTGREGRKTVELFQAVYRSQETGKPVRFPLK